MGLLFILGGTWLIGIANTIYGNLTLTYIFTILNSLQGFFIFIFNVALTDTFRQSMSGFCIWCNEEAGGSGNSNTVSFGRWKNNNTIPISVSVSVGNKSGGVFDGKSIASFFQSGLSSSSGWFLPEKHFFYYIYSF